MCTLALVVASVVVYFQLPVSLLPEIDVPRILVKVQYPNGSPEFIENNLLRPIRENLLTIEGLDDVKSMAGNESGQVELSFGYGTRMDLAYIEVNEKIDRLLQSLPKDAVRPQVIRVNASDIPILRIQVMHRSADMDAEWSRVTENIVKKRIEQQKGVSLVDIHGLKKEVVAISPKPEQLLALGITEGDIVQAIRSNNQDLGSISLADGQYRYYMRMANRLSRAEDIAALPVKVGEKPAMTLGTLCEVKLLEEEPLGLHYFDKQEGVVIAVHKQSLARMQEVSERVKTAVNELEKDFPQLSFHITRDQNELLEVSIDNLRTSLIFGGIFAFLVLLIFLGDIRFALILGLSLPISLLFSFLIFYLFNLSINIISLSGLALGLGMLIDNAIIVMDNISRLRKEGNDLISSCVQGVKEIQSALISSVLTTLSVFVPLVFLHGLSGALFFNQAIAVAAILGASLLVAFLLLPLLYKLFFSKSNKQKEDSTLYLGMLKAYKIAYQSWYRSPKRGKWLSLSISLAILPLIYLLYLALPVAGLPDISRQEYELEIAWNEPIQLKTNRDRILSLMTEIAPHLTYQEADIGISQFLMQGENASLQSTRLLMRLNAPEDIQLIKASLSQYFTKQFPDAHWDLRIAANAFDQLFMNEKPNFILQWRFLDKQMMDDQEKTKSIAANFPLKSWSKEAGLLEETQLSIEVNVAKVAQYGLEIKEIEEVLLRKLSRYAVTDIRQMGALLPVRLAENQSTWETLLQKERVKNEKGETYPLGLFLKTRSESRFKHITADKSGIFYAFSSAEMPNSAQQEISNWSQENQLLSKLEGRYFEDRENLKQLGLVLLLALALLYFILAAQFESFLQPLIVLFTLPLGIAGALLFLWIGGQSINIMSGIGIIVMLGIMVNDAILKVDTANRMRKNLKENGQSGNEVVSQALLLSGSMRLKPILMTTATTLLALLPILLSSGLGAELQKPLVWAVSGGLLVGTMTALFVVPGLYSVLALEKETRE